MYLLVFLSAAMVIWITCEKSSHLDSVDVAVVYITFFLFILFCFGCIVELEAGNGEWQRDTNALATAEEAEAGVRGVKVHSKHIYFH